MKKNTIIRILAIASFVTFFISCKRTTFDDKISVDTKEFTQKNCPQELDSYTRMDSMSYDRKSRTINYYYAVKDLPDVDSIYTESTIEDFRSDLLEDIRTSIPLKEHKEEGISFRYVYVSSTRGNVLMDITLTKEDYD